MEDALECVGSADGCRNLGGYVCRDLGPGEVAEACEGDGEGGVEVGAGDVAGGEDDDHDCKAGACSVADESLAAGAGAAAGAGHEGLVVAEADGHETKLGGVLEVVHQPVGSLLRAHVQAEHAAEAVARVGYGGQDGVMGVVIQARLDHLQAQLLHAVGVGHRPVAVLSFIRMARWGSRADMTGVRDNRIDGRLGSGDGGSVCTRRRDLWRETATTYQVMAAAENDVGGEGCGRCCWAWMQGRQNRERSTGGLAYAASRRKHRRRKRPRSMAATASWEEETSGLMKTETKSTATEKSEGWP